MPFLFGFALFPCRFHNGQANIDRLHSFSSSMSCSFLHIHHSVISIGEQLSGGLIRRRLRRVASGLPVPFSPFNWIGAMASTTLSRLRHHFAFIPPEVSHFSLIPFSCLINCCYHAYRPQSTISSSAPESSAWLWAESSFTSSETDPHSLSSGQSVHYSA